MKESPRKVLSRLKRNFVEMESERISQGLKSQIPAVIVATLKELGKLKDPLHTHEAMNLLDHSSDEVVVSALRYLEKMEHPLPKERLMPLFERGIKVKKELAKAVTLVDYKTSCELLKMLVRDASFEVKRSSLKSIIEVGCADDLEYVKELSKSEDSEISILALETLIELGEEIEEKALEEMVFNAFLSDKVRKKALKLYLKNSLSSLEMIEKVVKTEYLPLLSVAFEFLGEMKCDDVWKMLESILKAGEKLPSKIVPLLSSALKSCASNSELGEIALSYLDHPSKKVKALVLKTLIKVESPHAMDVLSDFLNSSDSYLVQAAIPFVYHFPTEENVERLREILTNGDEKVIVAALKVLRRLKLRDDNISKYIGRNYPLAVRRETLKTLVSLSLIDAFELEAIVKSNESLGIKMEALEGLAKIAPEKLSELEVA